MIFTLYNKQTKQETTIYSVRNKNGYPMFLIYERGQWLWKSAKHFKPLTMNVGGVTITSKDVSTATEINKMLTPHERKGGHLGTDNN